MCTNWFITVAQYCILYPFSVQEQWLAVETFQLSSCHHYTLKQGPQPSLFQKSYIMIDPVL